VIPIAGYAVTWSDLAEVDDHLEQVRRGAFRHQTCTNLRVAHDRRPGAVLQWAIPVAEDDRGLLFAAMLNPDKLEHRRVVAALRSGMTSVSIAYRPTALHWEGDTEIITAARLLEISLLGAGAFAESRAWLI
jgi:HK97 family phage prohead protease